MTLEEMREKAIRAFMKPKIFTWRQATHAVGQEKLGKEDWEVIRTVGAFGGGLGLNGEVCGALIGSLAVLGLRFSRGREEGKEDPRMWGYSRELLKLFRDEIIKSHGGICCRESAGVDWINHEQVANYFKGEKFLECARILRDTAKLTGEILEWQT